MTSIVQENLLTRRGYISYSGATTCNLNWPRTRYNGTQFACRCGWQSSFAPEFIKRYREAQTSLGADLKLRPYQSNALRQLAELHSGTLQNRLIGFQPGMGRSRTSSAAVETEITGSETHERDARK